MVYVDHCCAVCFKEKETMRPLDERILYQYGYQPVNATTWQDSNWLCSMACTEKG